VYVNTLDIDIKKIKIDYNNKEFNIMPPTDLRVELERFNESKLINDQYLSKGFDFRNL